MTSHETPLAILREWAGVGQDVHFRMHQFRTAFATWGCSVGVVNYLILKFYDAFSTFYLILVVGRASQEHESLAATAPGLCAVGREVF